MDTEPTFSRNSIRTGPAVVRFKGHTFEFKDGVEITEELETFEISTARFGKIDDRVDQRKVTIKGTPAGQWEALAILFAVLDMPMGGRLRAGADEPLVIYDLNAPGGEGGKRTYHNAALTGPPSELTFLPTETILGEISFTCRAADGAAVTDAAALFTVEDITEDDAEAIASPDFAIPTQAYRLKWGGDEPWDGFEASEGVRVTISPTWQDVPGSDRMGIVDEQLTGLEVTARFKPAGIAQADIDAKLALQGPLFRRGASLAARGADLDIVGEDVFVRVFNSAMKSNVNSFALTAIRPGEVVVVATRRFQGGQAAALAYVGHAAPENGSGSGQGLGDDIAVYMPFDGESTAEALADVAGHEVALSGSATLLSNLGVFGDALELTGSSSLISVADVEDAFPVPGEPWSLRFRFRLPEIQDAATDYTLVSLGEAPEEDAVCVGLTVDTEMRLRVVLKGTAGDVVDFVHPVAVTAETWHSVAVLHDGERVTVEYDGLAVHEDEEHAFDAGELAGVNKVMRLGVWDINNALEERTYLRVAYDELVVAHNIEELPAPLL